MTLTNQQRDEAILRLASLTNEDGSTRLPGLRVECPWPCINGRISDAGRSAREDDRCKGRGWRPIPWDYERELRLALQDDGCRVHYDAWGKEFFIQNINPRSRWRKGDELIDAAAQAYKEQS